MTEREEAAGGARVPGADAAEIQRTARHDLCDLPVSDRTDTDEFFFSVLRYMQQWYRSGSASPVKGVAAFVFVPHPRLAAEAIERPVEQVRFFDSAYDRELDGFVHVSGAGIDNVRRVATGAHTVEAAADELAQLALNHYPAVLVDLQSKRTWLCPEGCEHEELCRSFVIKAPEDTLDLNSVDRFLYDFHEVYLNPNQDQGIVVWANRARGVPAKNVEKLIQKQLFLLARIVFRDFCATLPEIPTPAGRIDVLVRPQTGGGALLELKVLRDRYDTDGGKARSCSPKENETSVIEGIDQANDYRSEVHAELAFLCCYDMRDADSDAIDRVAAPLALKRNVELRRYFLARDAKMLRRRRDGSAYREWDQLRGGAAN